MLHAPQRSEGLANRMHVSNGVIYKQDHHRIVMIINKLSSSKLKVGPDCIPCHACAGIEGQHSETVLVQSAYLLHNDMASLTLEISNEAHLQDSTLLSTSTTLAYEGPAAKQQKT